MSFCVFLSSEQFSFDSVSGMSSVGGRQRLSERSSLSSITSQGSRQSSDVDSFMELHSIVADMERAKLANSEQTKPVLDPALHTNATNLSSAFQPLIDSRQERQQTVNCFTFDEQTQNLMKNVKSIAESMTNSAAKRALTFAHCVNVDKEDSIRYNFEKGEYCDMLSPGGSVEERNAKTPDIHRNLFKPIDTANRGSHEPCNMHKPMATQLNHDNIVNNKPQQISILSNPRNSVQNNVNKFAWSRSNSHSPGSVSTACPEPDKISAVRNITAPITSKQPPTQNQKPVKPVRYSTPVVSMSDNYTLPSQTKYCFPMASTAHTSPHIPLMIDTNMPELLPKAPVFIGKDAKYVQQLPVTPSHPQLIKYGTKVPMVLPPGTVLPQPLIPPEGYDLVAIDAYGRMVPVQYTDVMYDMSSGYMYGYQPFMPNFKTIRY